MALSRTARVLLAILLLAAAAFFWVNFFTQNRPLAGGADADPIAAAPPATPSPTPAAPAAEVEAVADEAIATDAETDAAATPEADGAAAAQPAPPVVVVDPPVAVRREVVVADLPFLVTSPPAFPEEEAAAEPDAQAVRALTAARTTINPFSPVVVRTPPAPQREVPELAEAPQVAEVTEVAVPTAPAAIPGPRLAAPTPEVRAPTETVVRDLPRALPTGTPLTATPDIIRQPRTAAAPLEERIDVAGVAAIRVPEAAATVEVEAVAAPRTGAEVVTTLPEPLGPGTAQVPAPAGPATPQPPLAAGTNVLSRFLRDNGWTFTGSALGPVSVGVFRSQASATPVIVALGQTLPDTEIVLTDLRGQQAELTLGDMAQILVLDLRR